MDFFGEYTGLYFYSAVFQGNMALLALVGVFAVYRLQHSVSHRRKIEEHIESRWRGAHAKAVIRSAFGEIYNTDNVEREIDDCRKQVEEHDSSFPEFGRLLALHSEMRELTPFVRECKEFARFERKVKTLLSKAMILTMCVIISSLFLLTTANALHRNALVEGTLMLLTIVLNVVSLKTTFDFVRFALEEN